MIAVRVLLPSGLIVVICMTAATPPREVVPLRMVFADLRKRSSNFSSPSGRWVVTVSSVASSPFGPAAPTTPGIEGKGMIYNSVTGAVVADLAAGEKGAAKGVAEAVPLC